MTDNGVPTKLVCHWCGQEFERRRTRGPVPKYCNQAHRQRAFEWRKLRVVLETYVDGDVFEKACREVAVALGLGGGPP